MVTPRQAQPRQKVFGVGLSKTGTTSLTAALKRLGYRCRHYPHLLEVVKLAEEFDALTDSPVISYMELLDRFYPTAKFVLTVRNEEEWIESCRRHFSIKPLERIMKWKRLNRRAVYGTERFDEKVFRRVFHDHRARVERHFEGRPGKLLVIDICGGDGYEVLCPFLGMPVKRETFPYKNKAALEKKG